MLKRNRLMCLVLPIFFTMPSTFNPFPSAMQIIEKQVDNKEMVQTNKLGLIKNPIQEQYEKDKAESDKKKAEEEKLQQIKREKELEEQKKRESEPEWQEFVLTFYTSSISENSSAGAVTCQGKKLQPYMIANNVYSLGTKIYLEGYGTKTVSDRGSNKHFGTSNRLDVYIEREQGESESQYLKRVNGYGVKKVRGYIVK